MIDRICPKCGGKAAVTIFENEIGQLAKLWKCEQCAAVWGVPQWNVFARDNQYDFGLKPWSQNEASGS
jgi:hypothetical protein